MSTILQKNGITYRLLEKSDLQDVSELISKNSVLFDPMVSQLGITIDEAKEYNNEFCNLETVDKILSFVAVDDASGKIVAICINDDHLDEPLEFETVSPKYDPYFEMLEQLNQRFFTEFEIGMKRNECFHLIIDEIAEEFDGKKGIYETLFQLSIELAEQEGFKYILEEAVDDVTMEYFKSIGFEELGRIYYKDFTYKGTKPFANIKGKCNSAGLFIKYLANQN